jgi:hypothetical protein
MKRTIRAIRSDRRYTPNYPKDGWAAAMPTGQAIFWTGFIRLIRLMRAAA